MVAVLIGTGAVQGVPVAAPAHEPVMRARVAELLAVPGPDGAVIVDATIGAGGHAAMLMSASGEQVHLVGFDRDPEALDLAGRRLAAYGDRVHLVHASYEELVSQVSPVRDRVGPVLGVFFDLGVSSLQLDRPGRGFSFLREGPLDMRMDPRQRQTAADLVNRASVDELIRVIRTYGEERFARRIAEAIEGARPLQTTRELAAVVEAAVPARARRPGVHPATRTFQALRIAVNGELDRFSASLPQALELATAPAAPGERGGRVAVLAYHSLEDRLVKQVFRDAATGCVCPPDLPVCACGRTPTVIPLTRGAERPEPDEVARNPRARSARFRAVEAIT